MARRPRARRDIAVGDLRNAGIGRRDEIDRRDAQRRDDLITIAALVISFLFEEIHRDGGHVHIQVRAGRKNEARGLAGTLIFEPHEWEALAAMIRVGRLGSDALLHMVTAALTNVPGDVSVEFRVRPERSFFDR